MSPPNRLTLMKTFSTPLLIILLVVALGSLMLWRGAKASLNTASAELTTASNKLAEATAKLAEQGAANETLRVRLSLSHDDFKSFTNRVTALAEDVRRGKQANEELQRQLAKCGGELRSAEKSGAELRSKLEAAQERETATAARLSAATAESEEKSRRIAGLSDQVNLLELENAAFLQKLSDPSALRARLSVVTAKPAGKSVPGIVALQPDGTVVAQPLQ